MTLVFDVHVYTDCARADWKLQLDPTSISSTNDHFIYSIGYSPVMKEIHTVADITNVPLP